MSVITGVLLWKLSWFYIGIKKHANTYILYSPLYTQNLKLNNNVGTSMVMYVLITSRHLSIFKKCNLYNTWFFNYHTWFIWVNCVIMTSFLAGTFCFVSHKSVPKVVLIRQEIQCNTAICKLQLEHVRILIWNRLCESNLCEHKKNLVFSVQFICRIYVVEKKHNSLNVIKRHFNGKLFSCVRSCTVQFVEVGVHRYSSVRWIVFQFNSMIVNGWQIICATRPLKLRWF